MITLQEQISDLKNKRIQEIIEDEFLTKIQKIKLFETEQLCGYSEFIQNEFPEWEKEALELERLEAERILKEGCDDKYEICARQFYQSKMTDSLFDPSNFEHEKYEIISYADSLKNCLENYLDKLSNEERNNVDKINPFITVMTTRYPYTELKKPYLDIVDTVFHFCIENKIWGYKNDW